MSVILNVGVQGEAADEVQGERVCPICLREVVGVANTVRTLCQHVFHQNCLQGWADAQPGASCPVCRAPLVLAVINGVEQQVEGQVADNQRDVANRRLARTCCGIIVMGAFAVTVALAGAGVFNPFSVFK